MKSFFYTSSFWLVLGLICTIIIWFTPWRFQTNDDVIMMWLVSGAYTGIPEGYAVFIHPLLSEFFAVLYRTFNGINWYGLTWYSILYFSYASILQVICQYVKSKDLRAALSAFALMTTLHFCLFPQFTIVAGWAGIAGLLLLFSNKPVQLPNLNFFLGFFLLISSLLVRIESFALVGIGFGIYYLLDEGVSSIENNWKTISMILLLFFLVFSSQKLYETQVSDQEFIAFNKARASVIDHPVFYHLSKEEGFTEKKWKYFSKWMIDGLEVDSEELTVKKAKLNQLLFSTEYLGKSFSRLMTIGQTELFKSTIALLLFFMLVFLRGFSVKLFIFLVFWFLFFLCMNFFFILQGRVLVLFALVIWFPLLLNDGSIQRNFSIKWAPVGFLVLFIVHFANTQNEANGRKLINKELNTLLSSKSHDSPVFTEGFYEYNYLIPFSKENQVPTLTYGWISQSAFQRDAFRNKGFSNIQSLNDFYLLEFKSSEEPFFPKYFTFLNGEIQLVDKKSGEFFNLMHYRTKPN